MLRRNLSVFGATFGELSTRKSRGKSQVIRKAAASAVELLENRQMMSAYTPSQIRSAYGVDSISLGGTTGDGSGQTIAIVIPFYNSKLTGIADTVNGTGSVDEFNQFYGLQRFQNGSTVTSGPKLTVLNQSGVTSPLPSGNSAWDDEEALDIEWAHAIAPQANIVLFAASSASDTDLFAANQTAAGYNGTGGNVSVVSNSWSEAEPSANAEATDDGSFVTPSGHQNVTFLAAAGDEAAYNGSYSAAHSSYPSVSPNVISVGGTSLSINTLTGAWSGEGAWQYSINTGNGHTTGGGGGISLHESQPSYQTGNVNGASTTNRTTPDVSMDADPNTGMYIFDYADTTAPAQPFALGGTSFATPMWAGLVAIADQGRQILNGGTPNPLNTSQAQSAIYSASPSYFHDVTTGNNGYVATSGYDMATGRGTPVANLLVPGLAGYGTNHLAFASPPTISIAAGISALPTLTINVEDSTGSVLTSDSSNVTLTVYNSMGENIGVLGGTAAAVNGIATFKDAWLSPPTHLSGTYTLEASAGGALAAMLNFAVTPESPATIPATSPTITNLAATTSINNASLITDVSGNIFGTTEVGGTTLSGGSGSDGEVFKIAAGTHAFSILASFPGGDSSNPEGQLAIDSSGNIFGTTFGASSHNGTLFEVVAGSGTVTTLHTFDDTHDGKNPVGGVVLSALGDIYGTASAGGSIGGTYKNDGTIFKYSSSGGFAVVHTFGATDGKTPESGLAIDSTGNIYGTATGMLDPITFISYGGSVFKITSGGTFSTVGVFAAGLNEEPSGQLNIDSAGNLFGATVSGGSHNSGTIFEVKGGSNVITTLANFGSSTNLNAPIVPRGGVLLDRNGNLWGTTYRGGTHDKGVIFELPAGDMTGAVSTVYSFAGGSSDGAYSYSNLVLDVHGNIFGATSAGGTSGAGTAFEVASIANPIWLQFGSSDTWSNSSQTLTPTGTAWISANPSDYGDLPIVTSTTGSSQILRIGPTNGDTTVDINSISLTNGAQARVDKTPTADSLTINVSGLTVSGTGSTFDLNNSQMYINYGSSTDPIAAIKSALTSGYAAGAWNGSGIDSSAAAADSTHKRAIGYKDAANSIHLMYTLYGDADLNGTVDANDYATVVRDFGATPTTWDQGDFDYNDTVDANDYATVVRNFGLSV